jgi:Ca2+-binding RTX toxin-like protein
VLRSRAASLVGVLVAGMGVGVTTAGPVDGAMAATAARDFFCHGQRATIVGHLGGEVLNGTPGDDVMVARGGDDLIWAGSGDDVVCGGPGKDDIHGGPGDDLLLGQGDQFAVVDAGDGTAETLVTGDTISPGPGRDRVVGGYDPRQARANVTALPDRVAYSKATGPIVARLGEPGGVGIVTGQGRDRIAGQPVQGISGSKYDDLLIGSSARDRISGNAGEDVLRGRGGDDEILDSANMRGPDADADVLAGGAGDDAVSSRFGVDQVSGGSGDDQISAAPQCHTIYPGAGQDHLLVSIYESFGTPTEFTFDAGQGRIRLGSGAQACGSFGAFDRYTLAGGAARVTFLGTEGADVLDAWLDGAGLTAHLFGGDDVASGTKHDDVFFAGAGTDTVDAGDGDDVCVDTEVATSCESSTAP